MLVLARGKKLDGFTSQSVIDEIKNNLDTFSPGQKTKINEFIRQSRLIVRERIAQDEIRPYLKIVEKKDAHVLAGAISTDCTYLVTLDKKHLDNSVVKGKVARLNILAPKELLGKLVEND